MEDEKVVPDSCRLPNNPVYVSWVELLLTLPAANLDAVIADVGYDADDEDTAASNKGQGRDRGPRMASSLLTSCSHENSEDGQL